MRSEDAGASSHDERGVLLSWSRPPHFEVTYEKGLSRY
jgi:hypothetical protein